MTAPTTPPANAVASLILRDVVSKALASSAFSLAAKWNASDPSVPIARGSSSRIVGVLNLADSVTDETDLEWAASIRASQSSVADADISLMADALLNRLLKEES